VSLKHRTNVSLDKNNWRTSKVSGKIHIIGNSGWSAARASGICTGSGNFTHPYVIEDLVIDGMSIGSGIWIENSDVFFRIENCSVTYAGDFGIYLNNVSNGWLFNISSSLNFLEGVRLYESTNVTISDNNVNNNNDGIRLYGGINNSVSGNQVNDNNFIGVGVTQSEDTRVMGNSIDSNAIGIDLWESNSSIVTGNIVNGCGLRIFGNLDMLFSNALDTTNLVNGKSFYYYMNETSLKSSNFTNAGQVILVNCNNSRIANLNVSHCSYGISLYYCNNNTIVTNDANSNLYGIRLEDSNNNSIYENTANYNFWNGIDLLRSNNNNISGNSIDHNSVGVSLWKSNKTFISENNMRSNSFYGLWLDNSNNNTITKNEAYSNSIGIKLDWSNYNKVTDNKLIGNEVCFSDADGVGNIFSDNNCGLNAAIPGYNLFFLLSVISCISLIIFKKIQNSR
jgi:parallel beta-helix repeat protein